MGMWLASLSTLKLWTGIVLVAAGASTAGLYFVRRAIHYSTLKPYNDVVGLAHGTIGVVYAVVLGFTIIVSWEQFDAADRNVGEEASTIADLYNDNKLLIATYQDQNGRSTTSLLPSGDELNTMQWALQDYVNAIVESEWDAMAAGRDDVRTRNSYAFIWASYAKYTRDANLNPLQSTFFGESLRKLNDLGAHRRARLLDARKSLPPRFWTLLVGCGMLIVAFSFLYGIEKAILHVLISTTLAALIGVCLALILSLEHSFLGGTAISKQPFVNLQSSDPWSIR